MKLAVGWFSLALAIFLTLVVQELVPPLRFLHDARIFLVPMLFCYGALAMPFWAMLLMAIYTGFLIDLLHLNVVNGHVEIALGWSIVVFVFFGLFAHGFQPAFLLGRWWVHVPLSAAFTSIFLALQFIMICFRREGIFFNETVAWRIFAPGLIAAFLAPLVHLAVIKVAPHVHGPTRLRPFRRIRQ
ncbi:MAG TPA: hypothetical protein VIS99_03610 [Terrimicrobiaceae bacterium]